MCLLSKQLFNLWLWWFNQESFLRIQPVRELLLWATQNYQWFKKMMGLWLLEPLGASHLAQQLKSRDQIKHIWVRAGLWFRAPCSLYYLQIKHTADDFICGRLYWLPDDSAAGYLFLKKVANRSLAVIFSTPLWSDRRAPGRGSSNFLFFLATGPWKSPRRIKSDIIRGG